MGYVIAAYGVTLVALVGYGLHLSRERARERAREHAREQTRLDHERDRGPDA